MSARANLFPWTDAGLSQRVLGASRSMWPTGVVESDVRCGTAMRVNRPRAAPGHEKLMVAYEA
jgi:hypothetical protein